MASSSGSPRSRIDQFFPSKKKKPAKGEKANHETKNLLDASPSAKGSLAGYLVKSPSTTSPSARLVSDRGTPPRHDPIKRNLTREINLSLDFVRETTCVDSLRGGEVLEKSGEQKGLPHDEPVGANQLDESSSAANGLRDDAISSRGNSEIKRFATDFLSLYCSDVPSIEEGPKGQKRNHSPPNSAAANKACLKKHRIVDHNISPPHASMLPGEDCHDLENLALCYNVAEAADASPRELDDKTSGVGMELNRKNDVFTCLRKCVNTAKSNLNKTGSHTPGSAARKFGNQGTPRSGYKCSMFSPGEEFWNEAIQVVDGLLAPTDSRSLDTCPINNEGSLHNMCALESGGSTNKCADARLSCNISSQDVKKLIKPSGNNVENEQIGTSVCSKLTGTNAEQGNNVSAFTEKTETSPLPVKHFDFISDERKDVAYGHSVKLDSESVNVRSLKNSDAVIHCKHLTSRDRFLRKIDSFLYQEPGVGSGNLSLLSEGPREVKYDTDTSIADGGKGSIKDDPNPLSGDASFGTPISDPPVSVKKREDSIISNCKNAEASTPSSNFPLNDSLQLQNWLPPEICCIYSMKGITKLYPWQVDCLQVDGVLERRNLVYCASTSAGKSFVAEILMLRRVMQTGKMAILVLPYVSICAEKTEHLEALLEPLGKHVRSFYGNQGGGSLPKDTSVAVCTIEKANSLVNRLLEEGRLSEVGIIVIDELHMVGDQHRGYLLELMLTKLRYASGEGSSESSSGDSSGSSTGKNDITHGLQIVGMSATMPNVGAVADWLQAALYQTEFRPVPLEEFIKVGNNIFNKKLDLVRTISKTSNFGGKDPDHIVELCNEIVLDGHSVLLFCSSRKGCESTARHISKFITKTSLCNLEPVGEFRNAASAIEALRRCPAGLDPILEETLPAGVAYHHAGLTVEEREIVETCYRKGIIHVLTATSTLAAGVNLPARRVIFRQPRIGRDFIDGTRYRQMAGRAGRTGIDTKGESILICKPEEVKRISGILNDSCPPLQSCLSDDKNGMTHAILEVVAGGIVQTASDIHRYVRCTLLNSTKPFQDVVKSAQDSLRWLCHNKFLEWNEENKLYKTTPLGRAAFGSSLSPEESLVVLDDLSRAREGFVLASDLHLVYLVTPINVEIEPDWELYYGRFMELSVLEQTVGNRVGVVESFLMRRAHGAPMNIPGKKNQYGKLLPIGNNCLSEYQALRVSKRFYVALMLSRLVQEIPIADVCVAFKVARGMIQSLQENAGRFASMVSMFCERLGWHDLEGLISKFQNRVSFGVRAEIVELTTIPYVKGSRARALYKAGWRTPLAIAEASTSEIAKALFDSSSWTTEEGSAMRRLQLGLAKKIKNGARKIVFEKAEEARLAAFSAFKSLGVEVPQFSVPLLSTKGGEGKLVASAMQDQKNREDDGVLEKTVDGSTNNMTLVINAPTVENIELSGAMPNGPCHANPNLLIELVTCDSLEERKKPKNELVNSSSEEIRVEDSAHVSIQKGYEHDETQRYEQNMPGHASGITCPSKGPVSAGKFPGGFDSFMDQWEAAEEFYFDVHFIKRTLSSSFHFEIFGLAICWKDSPVYYINLSKDLTTFCKQIKRKGAASNPTDLSRTVTLNNLSEIVEQRWKRITKVMSKSGVRKITWNLKTQIQVLGNPGISIQRFGELQYEQHRERAFRLINKTHLLLPSISVDGGIDICLAVWILWPDEESSSNLNLDKVVKKRLSSEAAAAANRDGRWRNQMHKAAHNGCCHRVSLTRALCSFLWRLLDSENLLDVLIRIENPLVKVLADMEFWGIGVDMEACILARSILLKKLKELEKEAFNLAGISFSLNSSADIAFVLYTHLKLPVPGGCIKGKQHPSTNKHSLDLLRNCHPIVPVIKEHRTLAKLLNSTVGSICSKAKLCLESERYIIHGHWLQTSTATGRLSVEDPNLQCVEHMIEFVINNSEKNGGHNSTAEHHKINARHFFIPTQESWVLVTADYSQIELRIMAHFSRDSSLIELLSKPDGDVFTMLAAKWTGTTENEISSKEREQTKRLVYGILYGMGAKTLAEQLECSSDEAAEKILSFKSSFPGVSAWLLEAVSFCRSKGYIETLMGRRRFLSKIKFGNNAEKSKAQRQAVNSICQGSAADIIKIAMINIHSVVAEGRPSLITNEVNEMQYPRLKGHCRILLQVHDELVLEVDPSLVREAGQLLADSMETAASLLVPLRVKLKAGRTWGSLEPYNLKS